MLKKPHGNAAKYDPLTPRLEVKEFNKLPHPNANETAANLATRRQRGRPFEAGNKAATGRRPKLALLGVEIDSEDPAYQRSLRLASRYRKRRCSELYVIYGYVSSGASGMIASAALAMAGSRYIYGLYSKDTKNLALIREASKLATEARMHEAAAMELCQREAAARPKSATDPLAAFMYAPDEEDEPEAVEAEGETIDPSEEFRSPLEFKEETSGAEQSGVARDFAENDSGRGEGSPKGDGGGDGEP